MTGDTTGRDDRVNSTHLDGPANHTPEGIDIAKTQTEHDSQKGALKVPHVDGCAGLTAEGPI